MEVVSNEKMHADELDIDVSLVRRLLAGQFPQWADLPLRHVASTGTVNALYRLGGDMVVRLPRRAEWAGGIEHEQQWLPRLAPHLPVAIPVPLGRGTPAEGYPCQWSVFRWLEGENPTVDGVRATRRFAQDLAEFVRALQQIDPVGAPPAGRGVALAVRDDQTRRAIAELQGVVDTDAATAAWQASLRAPAWDGSPVWIHGDLLPGNLLVDQGRLSAVIDFGGVGVGDPACDLMPAWSVLTAETRDVFRAALGVDDAMWERGRGWALSVALPIIPYYPRTNPAFVAVGKRILDEALADHRP